MRSRGLGTNIVITFFRQGFGLVITLGLVVLISRTFGPEGQGRYALAVFLPTVLVMFSNLGVPFANAYFLGRGDVSARSALVTSLKLWVVLSACGVVVGAVLVHFLADKWFPGVGRELLWIALGALPLALLHALLVSLLQGVQDFNRYNVAMFAQPVTALLLTASAIFVLRWDLEGALVAYGLSWLLSALAAWWVLTPHLRGQGTGEQERATNYAKRCIAYGWKVQVSINLAFLSYRASTLLINYFMSPKATGVYVIAVMIAEKIWLLSQAASQVLLPRLSELHTDEERRRRLTPLATKIVFAISAAIAVVLFAAARPIIVVIFGVEFSGSIGALRWLLPGIVLMSAARTLAIDLAARGRVDLNLYVAFMSLAMNVVASVVLIPRYGINGAAIGATLSYAVNFVVLVVMYKYLSGNSWFDILVWRRADYRVIRDKVASLRNGS